MPRWILVVLLVAAAVCAGIGTDLVVRVAPLGSATFGWTAYAPLSSTIRMGDARYMPVDPTWLLWIPRFGVALIALGAGTAGATIAALLLSRRPAAPMREDA